MKWADKDMLRFARVASGGAYGLYEGCKSLESKLTRYKKLSKDMSRYIKTLDNGKEIAYGWDHATGYFFQVFDAQDFDNDLEDQDIDKEYLLINECSTFTRMSNGKMIELMSVYKLPESHIERVAMDLPIE